MAVYVDDAVWPWRGQLWCHLAADSLDELHAFAKKIGMKRVWFQCPPKTRYPHYDLNENRRRVAIEKGALAVDKRVLLGKTKLLMEQYRDQVAIDAILAGKPRGAGG
jgi:hypothetical protein